MPVAAASRNGSIATATPAIPKSMPSTGSNSSPSPRPAITCSGSWRTCRSTVPDSAVERGYRSKPTCTAAASNRTPNKKALKETARCIAFSSEVGTGSREENASNNELEPGFDSIRTELALAPAKKNPPSDTVGRGVFVRLRTLLERLLLVEHRGLCRLVRRPEAIAEGREDRHALGGRREVRGWSQRQNARGRRMRKDFLRRPQRQARRTEVVLDQATGCEQLVALGVAQKAERMQLGADAYRSGAVASLVDAMGERR